MTTCECPICHAEYQTNPKLCTCGFEGLSYPIYENDRLSEVYEREMLFRIYKFTKRVYHGEISYGPSQVSTRDNEHLVMVDYVKDKRGLALVDMIGKNGVPKTLADAGLLAFQTQVQALILNVNYVNSDFLDESRVKVLFFSKNVEDFHHGFFRPLSLIRYLYVDADNPHFCADNHVMFSKDMQRLICYAPARPEEEYRIPQSVKVLGAYSFYHTTYLKRLYLPRGIKIENRAFYFRNDQPIEMIYE